MNNITEIRKRGWLHISLLPVFFCLLLPADALASVTSVWFIELPVFSDHIPADLFIERLAEKGFTAEVIAAQAGTWISYRTVTMPFSSFAEAVEYQSRLRGKTNLLNEHLRIVGPVAGLAGSWSVDLLHFSERGRAASFIKRLANKGINAVIIPVHITGKIHFQTRIVAIRSRMAAEAYLQKLKQRTNIRDQHLQLVAPMQLAVEKTSRRIASAPAGQALATPVAVKHDAAPVSPENRGTIKAQTATGQQQPVRGSQKTQDKLFPDWHIYGSNTVRSDVYNSKGNLAASPYRFSRAQSYDELNLNADRIFSPFHRITGQISGLAYNDSQYRSQFPGFVLERVNLRQENGAFFIPYRAEAGDFFAFQSYRTIQRSLKGGRIEFQPQLGGPNFHHSIEIFSGAASPAWDTFQYKDDFSSGASWLVQHSLLGSLAANLVLNHKQANGLAQPGLRQRVGSLAWEKQAEFLGQHLRLEAEAGRFVGDHPLVIAGRSNTRQQGNGFFGQVSGTFDALPQLSYRLRGEAYEQDYIPNGASIQSDRNSQEGYLTWRTATGLAFTSRLQHYHTAWQTNNPTDSITYGGNISGMMPLFGGISGSIDAFGSDVESRDLTTNTMAKVVNANLNMAITESLSLRGGFYYANNNNKNSPLGLNITRQYSLGADMRINIYGVTGTLSPGVIARRFDQQGVRRWDLNPTLNTSLFYGNHQLSLALSKLDQSSQVLNNGVDTMTAGLNYRYTQPKYTLGLDANWYDRQPDNAGAVWTNAWRVGAYLTYNFDKPVVKLAMAAPASVSDVTPARPSIERMLVDIARLTPGMSVQDAKAIVATAGLGEATNQAGFLLWYAQIFRDMSENQRLALDVRQGRIQRSAVIIDFLNQSDITGISTSFARMRRQLLAVYGQPDDFFDQGDFGPNLGVELAAGRFIRVMEWKRDGGTLRFGIPRRLDGKIRMELQFASTFPVLKETLWSMEAVQ